MATSAPPYVYPRQKPTLESVDREGQILVQRKNGGTYRWSDPKCLQDGDVWVPACFAFFREWAPDVSFSLAGYRRGHANRNWVTPTNEA